MSGLPVWLYLAAMLVCVAVVIAWIILPFAVFGLKPIMRLVYTELREIRLLLERRLPPK
jgi:hypothetical protein